MSASSLEVETFEFIERVGAAANTDEVYELLAQELGKFGFTNFLITEMPPPSFGLEPHMILNGWSKAWSERYVEQNFYRFDPMAKHTRETIHPFYWDEIALPDEEGQEAQRVMNEAADFGLKHGFSVPIFGAEGDQSCVTMGGERSDRPPRAREAIHLMSIYAHDRARALRQVCLKQTGPKLTEREREVLTWVALGKTDWEIGEILKISKETSYAHVRNCCRKLDAVTRTQAVVRAMMLRQITL
jgi:LuxR family quorum sensing-dependent transcriptional regulator